MQKNRLINPIYLVISLIFLGIVIFSLYLDVSETTKVIFGLHEKFGKYIHPLISLWYLSVPIFFSLFFLLLSFHFRSEKSMKQHLRFTQLFISLPIILFAISLGGSLLSIFIIFILMINSPPGYLEAAFKVLITGPLWIFPTCIMLGFWILLLRSINKRYHLLPKEVDQAKFITTNFIFSLFGPLGFHHFYLKNYREGIFYFFTLGKFTIGLFIDAYQLSSGKLLDHQKNPI